MPTRARVRRPRRLLAGRGRLQQAALAATLAIYQSVKTAAKLNVQDTATIAGDLDASDAAESQSAPPGEATDRAAMPTRRAAVHPPGQGVHQTGSSPIRRNGRTAGWHAGAYDPLILFCLCLSSSCSCLPKSRWDLMEKKTTVPNTSNLNVIKNMGTQSMISSIRCLSS
ncbi:hypothetical protein [Scleromatobacter humisilvae]|uniref:Uncharacterized protein n=1 Tax=Scleromatobacter humisilvae TaxID=2897159 RepID=A0A9X1YHU4_9BURK|nr:hypothetical protein [Scleromatobacter humisilvae]MCK9686408.1 hypothetical protein [Scleromatobacter humisilvae]